MSYKKYNTFLVLGIVVTLVVICLINFVVDPYDVFSHHYRFNRTKFDLRRQERLTKVLELQHLKNIETVFIGTSRTDFSLSPDYYNKISGKYGYNLAMQGLSFSEMKYLMDKVYDYQPNLKTVLIAVDFDFLYDTEESDADRITQFNSSAFNQYLKVILSGHALNSSVKTVIKSYNKNYKKGYTQDGMKKIFRNDRIDVSFGKTIHQYKAVGLNLKEPNLELLQELVRDIEDHNIEVVLFMPPVHSVMYEIIKQNGGWGNVAEFKKALAKIHPFYDFYYPCELSNEKISPDMQYYFECSHCTYLLGQKVLSKIFNGDGDFGVCVDKNYNIDSWHKRYSQSLSQWEKENPDWVKNIQTIREGE